MIATRKPVIELRRLHRFFAKTKAVNDVSFEVYQGQVYGYIGPNGAGKTTSMRILATLDLPTAGDALIDGFSVINDPDQVRRRLGFMPEAFGVSSNVNCREYLDFFARSDGLRGRERRIALEKTMAFTGLDVLAEKPISGLSKGMKQRLCLGRAMIHDPSVLILDEPAAGLDPRARIELREMIARLAQQGKTILVSSHILTELAEMCDVVGIIEQGQLLASGSVADIQRGQITKSRVRVRLLEDPHNLAHWLEERGGFDEFVIDGQLLTFSHQGERDEEVLLLREMVLAGFRVAEFGARHSTLEDVFLNVTRGRVQ